ncbi:hypothetical protein SESBI_39331, partial [Sesbania bispinosa]
VSKDPVESTSKELSPRTMKEKAIKEDWEKEILAMMSRFHSKRWEAHLRGDFVADPLCLDKSTFLATMQGLDAGSSLDTCAIVNLDRPPDVSDKGGTADQINAMEIQMCSADLNIETDLHLS